MPRSAIPSDEVDVRDLMNHSHARLDRLLQAALEAFEQGDRMETAALWTELETCLHNHLDFEEVHLLPSFRKVYPHEANQLAREHDQLRATLAELDLHLAQADRVNEFVAQLRAHAAREDALLYRFAKALEERRHLQLESKHTH